MAEMMAHCLAYCCQILRARQRAKEMDLSWAERRAPRRAQTKDQKIDLRWAQRRAPRRVQTKAQRTCLAAWKATRILRAGMIHWAQLMVHLSLGQMDAKTCLDC